MARRVPASLSAFLAATALAGCGADTADAPPKPPTPAEIARFVADTRQPAYWLGPEFLGVTVSNISVGGGDATLTYGPWSCSPGSGCGDTGGVSTGPRGEDLSDLELLEGAASRDCWSRIGKAVAALNGCVPDGYPQELLIYTGALQIGVTSIYTRGGRSEVSARTAARRLKPVNGAAPWPLAAPEPLSCAAFRRVDPRLRRHMPRPLRPTCRP